MSLRMHHALEKTALDPQPHSVESQTPSTDGIVSQSLGLACAASGHATQLHQLGYFKPDTGTQHANEYRASVNVLM